MTITIDSAFWFGFLIGTGVAAGQLLVLSAFGLVKGTVKAVKEMRSA